MDLIVQAPEIDTNELGALADLANAQGLRVLDGGGQQAFRLLRIASSDGVAEACAHAAWDWAFVAPDLRRERVSVVALDMDSTLITIECIDEVADMLGIKPQVAAVTESAMRGEIDFADSLTQRVALLAGLPVSALREVYDTRLELSPGAQRMLQGFRAAGAKTLLVSGGFSFFTDRLRERLGFDATLSNDLEIEDGKLTGRLLGPLVDAAAKAARLQQMRAEHVAEGTLVVAVGDGANDIPMLRAADVGVAYHAKPVVRAQSSYAINYCGLDAVLNLFA